MARDPAAGPDRGRAPKPQPERVPFRARSRLIAGAKVLLPLAALGLLSTVFLLARAPGGAGGPGTPVDIPYARLEEIARDPRIDRPRLAGVAADGTEVALSAERVTPLAGRGDAWSVAEPLLETRSPDGGWARLRASEGTVDAAAQALRLEGGVRLDSSAGLRVETAALSADLRTGRAESGPVTAEAPLGSVRAGALVLEQGDGGSRLLFHRGVRVLYRTEQTAGTGSP